MSRRVWCTAALLCSLVFLAITWASGCLVAGHDSPFNQCFAASGIEPVAGFNPNEHVNNPIEAWQVTNSHFTIWPTGLSCTYVNSNTNAAGTSRYVTWGPSIAVLIFALVAAACVTGALTPGRRQLPALR